MTASKTKLDIARESAPVHDGSYFLTAHAESRMYEGGLCIKDIRAVLESGQAVYDRGGIVFRIGRRIAAMLRADGLPVDRLEGLHVVTSPDGFILTVYRNHEFRRPRKTRKPAHVRARDSIRKNRPEPNHTLLSHA
jgi:hypothetical protein